MLGIAVLVGGPVNVAVQALAPSSLFRINARTLTRAAHQDARGGLGGGRGAGPGLYDTLQQTAINAFGSVRQRVAAHLLDLASAQQHPDGRLVATAPDSVLILDPAGLHRESWSSTVT